MEWNHYAIGGEVCRDPKTDRAYARLSIMDRMTGKQRSGPISDDEIKELIVGLSELRATLAVNS